MNRRTKFAAILLSFLFIFQLQAQNCGQVIGYSANITNNGNGTSTYTFQATVQAVSGGNKSVKLTIACPGGHIFVQDTCISSQATTLQVNFGPFTIATCSSLPELNWSGHTNSNCGGNSCNTGALSLPVELKKFEAKKLDAEVLLDWETASEINNEKFVVERSVDGIKYAPIGEVKGSGTTTEQQSYMFVDEKPRAGNNYYRLKQMDFDGGFEYSSTNVVTMDLEGEILIYPTVTQGEIKLKLPKDALDETRVTVFTLHGELLLDSSIQSNGEAMSIATLPTGNYLVVATNGSVNKRALIIKQ